MVKKLLSLLLVLFGLQVASSFAQTGGDLKGTVRDGSGAPVPFAAVIVEQDGTMIRGESTDFDGNFLIKGIGAGKYNVKVTNLGYKPIMRTGVVINNDRVTLMNDISMEMTATIITTFEVQGETSPVFEKGKTEQGTRFNRGDVMNLPSRDILSIAKLVGGVFSRDGEVGNFRGARNSATVYVDGVKIRGGSSNLPQGSVEEANVILGGVSAMYGDATGGIIEVTTRTISTKYFGSVEGRTSKFLDRWEDYLFSGTVGGPIIKSKIDSKFKGAPIAGFLATIEGSYQGDPSPVAGGVYKIKDDARQRLLDNPLQLAVFPQTGSRKSAEYLRLSDFEKSPTRQNVAAQYLNAQAKLNFRLTPSTLVSVGGFVNLNQQMGGRDGNTYNNSLMNWENNARTQATSWNIWGRIVQRFDGNPNRDTTRKGGITNAEISLQVDYLKGFSKTENPTHGDNFFNYGYVGKFTTYRTPTYTYGYDDTADVSGFLFTGFRDTLVTFEPGGINPLSEIYTTNYYNLFGSPAGRYESISDLQNPLLGPVINGNNPSAVYDLWSNIGTQYNGYALNDNNQFRLIAQGSIAFKNHDFRLGFEFEQRTDNAYSLSPVGLWTIARQLTNSHFGERDLSNPILVYNNGVYQDTVNYTYLYTPSTSPDNPLGLGNGQTYFDYSIRTKLGLAANGLEFIDIDTYDPSTFSIDMFSPNELLNQGNNLVTYYGYDAYGRKSGSSSFEDFFIARDDNGNYTRPIAPFQPIYLAGYIMDKFTFKDITFNVGVRVDRFDANQKVLKDRYSLYETVTAGDVSSIDGQAITHPTNVGENFVVYVNDRENPTDILGYRNGDTWYNATGEVVSNPAVLRTASGRVQPLMVNSLDDIQNEGFNPSGAFTDYAPQINVMPRIAFAFPIGDKTQFTAFYDVLTQRPSGAVRLNPLDYYFWDNASYNSGGVFFNNPNLRPERTTDFSLSFEQQLTETSAFKMTAFYRELRDMIALVKVNEAFPRSYGAWDNIDFGTVKGFTVEYNLRATNSLRFMGSYTLQFADGTGSDNTSQLNLVNSNQPNLRTTIPTNYDRRHAFTAYVIYHFGDGTEQGGEYNGPKGKFFEAIFKNLGASLTLTGGSGVPYSRQSNFTPTQTGGGQASLLGSINGARLPWEFNIDMRVDKSIKIVWGKKKAEGEDKRTTSYLNIYLQILNLFDNMNTISVYGATGSARDDGYLTAPQFQPSIAAQVDEQSFRDYYTMKVNDPRNFSLPRRIRLGATLSF